ncbi:hypothetical protein BCR43DRAFT_55770 [Syncephalastrum racemosum]|uniref:Uncharacterized protein n=1 Tax=Syncephalastrum racemosum TaxID=13706 RepID=A0A1X2HVF9_SYNRA|nr:hypothetical protein BCR43DRAFT_55770 [Syncephalastrum racemosum]
MIIGEAMQGDPETPAAMRQRPVCHYGRECRNKHTVSHAQRYQHWCLPRKPGKPSKASQKETPEMLETFSDGPSSEAASESELDDDEDEEDEEDD